MTYLSREQCRAARGLLNWTQQDLAGHTGLSKTSINNFERGISNVKTDTLNMIHKALTQGGILFLNHDGLQRRKESLSIIHGNHAMSALFDDIIDHGQEGGDPVIICTDINMAKTPHFNDGTKRLKKHGITTQLYQGNPYALPGMTSFCYGFKLAFYYTSQHVTVMIESPHAQRAEKCRLQNAENAIK